MRDTVGEYYGKVLQTSNDLKTNACVTAGAPAPHIAPLLKNLHEETLSTYYGCGMVYPPELSGRSILDLGCGTGRDCYVLAQLVGESGEVVGIDMTDEQLAIANRHLEFHRENFGYAESNVGFRKAYLEQLDSADLGAESFDVIVSNCVINLAIDKPAVLRHAFNLLKPGGELYFSDVYADRRIPSAVAQDPLLYGECLGGALYWNDFLNIAKQVGFKDPRLVEDSPIVTSDPNIKEKLGQINFYSATYRLFKLSGLEPECEDYGQAVVYKGTIPGQEACFILDKHHHIDAGRAFPVCGNTYSMLYDTRFRPHFDFIGNTEKHFGIFTGCGTDLPFDSSSADDSNAASACC
ncbi:MAG: methyltransferase domain-containing protein [Pseudomonadota bacterium]